MIAVGEPARAELPPDDLAQVRPRRRLHELLGLGPLVQVLARVAHALVDEAQRLGREVEHDAVALGDEAHAGRSKLGHLGRRIGEGIGVRRRLRCRRGLSVVGTCRGVGAPRRLRRERDGHARDVVGLFPFVPGTKSGYAGRPPRAS